MRFISNGRSLYYEIHGPPDGETVIALHHGLGTTRAWKNQVEPMAEAGFHLVTYDRWGYGKSDPRERFDLPGFRDDLDDLLNLYAHLDIDRAHLVGHSDGGTIALMLAAAHPKWVDRLVTIAAHIYLEPQMEPGIQGILKAYRQDEDFRGKFTKVHHGKGESLICTWYDDWHRPSVADWDLREMIASIECPTLVIQGTGDEHATPQHAIDIADAIPGTQLWLVPGGSHMLIEEMEDVFNPRLIQFLSGN